MKFKGRCGIIMWVTSILFLASTLFFISQKSIFDSPVGYRVLVITFGLSTVFLLSFVVRNYIVVSDSQIKVCLGPTTTVLEITSIVSMKKVTNYVASSGASTRRIEIIFIRDNFRKEIYVSPKDEDRFMQIVCEYNQDVKIY